MVTRFVALGDSTTEGMNDTDGHGGFRGWADRFAQQLAGLDPEVTYANLAVRGKTSGQILSEQLPAALRLRPDVAAVEVGLNDAMRRGFDPAVVAGRIETMVTELSAAGARLLVFTLPDPSPFMPLGRPLRPRLLALNAAIADVARHTGAAVVDLGGHPVVSDPRFWSQDRLHGNALGHARIAAAAAEALRLPGADDAWTAPLPPLPRRGVRERVAAEIGWARRHMLPWIARHAAGRSSGDGRLPKRPELSPVRPAASPATAEATSAGPATVGPAAVGPVTAPGSDGP